MLSLLCFLRSTARVKAGATTVYIAFQGGRFSADFSFVHSPAPRHLRIGWPDMELFDIVPPGYLEGDGMRGVSSEGPKLVLCTMFKNEATYLEEWLQYHQLLGVSKVMRIPMLRYRMCAMLCMHIVGPPETDVRLSPCYRVVRRLKRTYKTKQGQHIPLPLHVSPAYSKANFQFSSVLKLFSILDLMHGVRRLELFSPFIELQIHLYDNGSTDKSRSLLKKYEQSKFVQIHDWPHTGSQTEALNDCLCRFRHATRCVRFPQGC